MFRLHVIVRWHLFAAAMQNMGDIQKAVVAVPGCISALVARLDSSNAIEVREEAAQVLQTLAYGNPATQVLHDCACFVHAHHTIWILIV
jgi:hypothetical protein